MMREVYKYYSGISPHNKIFCIGGTVLKEFVNCTNLVDNETLALKDINIDFQQTNANVKGQKWNPERGLVRYQFMEMLLRLGIFKYRSIEDPAKAVK
jgi:hypothetical protein